MRLLACCLLLTATAACRAEPSFDERYNSTANEIGERATNLDEQLNAAQPENNQST